MSTNLDPLDPRPRIEPDGRIAGQRCTACRRASIHPVQRCPACGADLERAGFEPTGAVWASTVVRIPVPGREPPFGLCYVDLDDGPRVLAHVRGINEPVPVGRRVQVRGMTDQGDLEVEPT